jgi:hypothetical protein
MCHATMVTSEIANCIGLLTLTHISVLWQCKLQVT